MPYQHTIAYDVTAVGTPFRKTNNYSGSFLVALDEIIVGGASVAFTNFDVDVSAVVSLFMLADRDMTILVNDDGTPIATINLKANVPLIWTNDAYFLNPLGTVDVVDIKAVLTAGADASLIIEVIQDAIPVVLLAAKDAAKDDPKDKSKDKSKDAAKADKA